MAILENDYERMVPEFHKGTLTYAEHYVRYLAAQQLVKDRIVLDIASGSGYGTKMLAETASFVYGVDVNEKAIKYSKKKYNAKNIQYITGNGTTIPLDDNSVDVVISFETIEHIENYRQFMNEVSRVLRNDGVAVISTPNDLEFAEGNHFHIHEFTYNELRDLLKEHFSHVRPYFQATWKSVAIGASELFTDFGKIPSSVPVLNQSAIKPDEYLYFYMVCSNRKLTSREKIAPVISMGEHYSDRKLVSIESQHREEKQALEKRISILEAELASRGGRKYKSRIKKLLKLPKDSW